MHRLVSGVLALAFVGCASVTVLPPAPPAPPVETRLNVPSAQAFDRVVAAFVAEGLTIDQADRSAGLIKSAPVPGASVVAGGLAVATATSSLFYRATILPRDSGSTVALSVSGKMTMASGGRQETTEETPLSQCPAGESQNVRRCREGYDAIQVRLRQIAARIKQ
jgi:hypothetical protein